MKSILITATAVGAAVAGLILYYQRKSRPENKVLDAGEDAYHTINKAIGGVERPAHHAMG